MLTAVKKAMKGLTEQESELYKLKNIFSHPTERLLVPRFAAANSLVQMGQTNINITNIYKTSLIPGPASSYAAIYTALKPAQGISVWS